MRPGEAIYVHTLWVPLEWGPHPTTVHGSQGRSGLLVADDFHLKAGGPEYRTALLVFFVACVVAGVLFVGGGDVVTWVGFELLHSSYQLGTSQRRADWFVKDTHYSRTQDSPHSQV